MRILIPILALAATFMGWACIEPVDGNGTDAGTPPADLGAEGPEPDLGPTPEASVDQGGEVASDLPEPEDTVPEGGELPPRLPAWCTGAWDFIDQEMCEKDVCQKLAGLDELDRMGGSEQACKDLCLEQIRASDCAWTANAGCMAEGEERDLDICLAVEPIPLDESCVTVCAGLFGCGLEQAFELPPNAELCARSCSGMLLSSQGSDPEFRASFDCMLEELGHGCDTEGLFGCFIRPEGMCEEVCDQIFDVCSETPLAGLWPDREACRAACGGWEEIGVLVSRLCLDMMGCDWADRCVPPPGVPAACDQACMALQERCGPDMQSLGNPLLCRAMCTVMEVSIAPVPEGAHLCIRSIQSCPEAGLGDGEPEDPGSREVLECLFEPHPACLEHCPRMVDCAQGEMSMDECLYGCTREATLDPGGFEEQGRCLDEAGEDCEALFDCMFQVDMVDGMCNEFCMQMEGCGAIDEVGGEDCRQQCRSRIEGDEPGYWANMLCGIISGEHMDCRRVDACLEPFDVPAVCSEACDGAEVCQGLERSAPSLVGNACEYTCSAIFRVVGWPSIVLARCFVDHMGDYCMLENVDECFEQ